MQIQDDKASCLMERKIKMGDKKKVIFSICIVLIIMIGIGSYLLLGVDYYDCFDTMQLQFSGLDGNGKAKIVYVDDAEKDELLKFKIEPNDRLSNDDTVMIKVMNSKYELLKNKIILKDLKKEYVVTGLKDTKFSYPNEPSKNDSSDKDIKDYEAYWNNNFCEDCEDDEIEINKDEKENGTAPVTKEWSKGESENTTNKKDTDFFVVDYGNNSIETFKQANNFGLDSSQEYKIEPIVDPKGKNIGYSCIFNS